jgi:hypothetical protein
MRKLFCCLIPLILPSFLLFAGSLEKGFEALKVFNYFEAKVQFEKSMKSHPAGASYGLSTIFYKADNPFHNIDSAYKYILFSEKSFKSTDAKEKETILKLGVDQTAVSDLKEKIVQQAFEKAKKENTVESYSWFIKNIAPPALKKEAVKLRSKLAFENAKKINTAQSYKDFISGYPDADEVRDAKALYEFCLYSSLTKPSTLENYEAFVKQYPKSPFRLQAEDSIYAFSARNESVDEYLGFIKKYPENHNVKKAWDMIYSLSVIDFTPRAIANFLFDFPDFPDKVRVKADMERAKTSLFLIQQDGKWGFMDSLGTVRIPCTYDQADDFEEGASAVVRDGKAGYISKSGNVLIPLSYDETNSFHNGFAIVKKNNKFGLIHKTGKLILPFAYDDISYDESSADEKIFRAQKGNGYGFYEGKGKLLFESKFDKAGDFFSGRAYILQGEKYGFINRKGEIVIACSYDWTENFHNHIARVKLGEKFGLIDTSGKMILACEYDRIDNFSEGLALVARGGIPSGKEKKFGFTDEKGNVVIPIKYNYSEEISETNGFHNGLAKAEQNKKRGLIDKTGKPVIPCDYDDIHNFMPVCAGESKRTEFCAVKKVKWGFIDKNKKQRINFQFDYAWDFSDGLARVKIKGKTGFINSKGEQIIPASYDEATDFTNGISIVTLAGKKGVADPTGKLLVPCEMDDITEAGKGMLKLEKNEKFAYYNLSMQKQVWTETGF